MGALIRWYRSWRRCATSVADIDFYLRRVS